MNEYHKDFPHALSNVKHIPGIKIGFSRDSLKKDQKAKNSLYQKSQKIVGKSFSGFYTFTLQSSCCIVCNGTMTERKTLEVLLGNHFLPIEKVRSHWKNSSTCQVAAILRKSLYIYICLSETCNNNKLLDWLACMKQLVYSSLHNILTIYRTPPTCYLLGIIEFCLKLSNYLLTKVSPCITQINFIGTNVSLCQDKC